MLVKNRDDQTLIKVVDTEELIDPFKDEIQGKQQAGQSEQPPQAFNKSQLVFPSGEALPQCWIDPDYRQK
ncbi:acetyltransferase [Oscillatoria sp. CS-180]|uniref:acetyltransferase n=1 Tax=Oscillatoria sp. CS-180 TaxID=3021720 RepID=UPI00232AE6F0|nr:acetyltransferase [Oscillatoria sp. CS-180]MDB9526669.1 acetyltransferase [Oscillatoria sp. CS-180]